MENRKFWKQEIKFHIGLHVLIAIFITIANYVYLPFNSPKGNVIYFSHFVLLHFSLFGFIYMFSLFSKVFKVVFPLLFIFIASFSFWVYSQDLTIGEGMIQRIFGTNIGEATDVLSYQFVFFVLISSICILVFFRFHRKKRMSNFKSPLIFVAIFGVISFFIVENYKFDAFKNRLPYSVYFGFVKYFQKSYVKLKNVEEMAFTNEKDLHIVLVIGESVRADHLSLNGYQRNTTPLLSKQNNLISFKNTYTPFTFTAKSLPQILTDKSIDSKPEIQEYVSLYSVLNKASFNSEWIGNQVLEKSYAEIINSNKSKLIIDELHSFLSFKKEKDLAILDHFNINESYVGNKMSSLHMIGSHWYYKSRITDDFEHFKPTIQSKYLGSLTSEELINSYDNTIVYLDFFLNELIEKLKKSSKKTILLYISDHGETLGEDGNWLHAQEHKASKNPAMLVWFSDNFEKSYPLKIENMKAKKLDSIATDFLFHSVLDLGNIENFEYNKNQSIFK